MVNYTNIWNAVKVIVKPSYTNLRIAHRKDRCANPPRSGLQASGMKRIASGNTTVGVNDGIDGGHVGDNDLGLAVNVSEDTPGIKDGGEEVLNVNA